MAQRVLVQLVSDLTGEEIADGKGETVAFSLDGQAWELDMTSKEADKFRGIFQDYVAVARKVGGSGRKKPTPSKSDYDAKAVRAWAVDQGIDIPARGRIPSEVLEQYKAAH